MYQQFRDIPSYTIYDWVIDILRLTISECTNKLGTLNSIPVYWQEEHKTYTVYRDRDVDYKSISIID